MIFLAQCEKPVEMLRELERRGRVRRKKRGPISAGRDSARAAERLEGDCL